MRTTLQPLLPWRLYQRRHRRLRRRCCRPRRQGSSTRLQAQQQQPPVQLQAVQGHQRRRRHRLDSSTCLQVQLHLRQRVLQALLLLFLFLLQLCRRQELVQEACCLCQVAQAAAVVPYQHLSTLAPAPLRLPQHQLRLHLPTHHQQAAAVPAHRVRRRERFC